MGNRQRLTQRQSNEVHQALTRVGLFSCLSFCIGSFYLRFGLPVLHHGPEAYQVKRLLCKQKSWEFESPRVHFSRKILGPVTQLVEFLVCIEDVEGSTPFCVHLLDVGCWDRSEMDIT